MSDPEGTGATIADLSLTQLDSCASIQRDNLSGDLVTFNQLDRNHLHMVAKQMADFGTAVAALLRLVYIFAFKAA